jgi:signal recognition particle subunit SRP54
MFDSLSNKLQGTLQTLRGQKQITEANIEATVSEVRKVLLESDVSLKAVKLFIQRVREQALGSEVLRGIKPGEQFIKIIHNELSNLLGGKSQGKKLDEILNIQNKPSSILMLGLQGAGKTTASAKLALRLQKENYKPLLVACDLQRPAAIKQLQILAEQAGVDCFALPEAARSLDLAKVALDYAQKQNYDVLIYDTAGRLQVDTDLMAELLLLERNIKPSEKLLVIDSLIGQEAANTAETFNTQIGLSGIILSKLDGDSRGGAALSIVEATQKPIKLASTGEKLEDFENFYPERMASRILGMGDVLSLVEKAEEQIKAEEAEKLEAELMKGNFNYETFLAAQKMMANLGNFSHVFNMLGMGSMLKQFGLSADDQEALLEQGQSKITKFKFAINSMTKAERRKPDLLSQDRTAKSRQERICKGSGLKASDISQLVSEFKKMQNLFKNIGPMLSMMQGGSMETPPRDMMSLLPRGFSDQLRGKPAQAQIKKGTKPSIKNFR